MNNLSSYQLWLEQQGYSVATIRNYIIDINKYLNFVSQTASEEPGTIDNQYPLIFSIDLLSAYIDQLTGNTNSQRYLASLSTFCQFAVDQQLISSNPIIKIRKQSKKTIAPNPVNELHLQKLCFSDHLIKRNYPQVTIRNYLNDVEQYINWLEAQNLGPK
ncbi:hypothetical protein HYV64_04155 [Candidatus Shapirobacteria bacterium]|nr:hypothetical protein [Candidatus Shapirobacteria bacterium]